MMRFIVSMASSPSERRASVRMLPGSTALIVMPWAASSTAAVRMNPIIPAFVPA